jgi:dGTPase
VKVLGNRTKVRINTAIADIWKNSLDQPFVRMSDEVMAAINELRDFMFENVYALTNKSMQDRAERMLTQMFEYFMNNVDKLPKQYLQLLEKDGKERVVCDYLSGMTDRYAISVFESLFIPSTFSIAEVRK